MLQRLGIGARITVLCCSLVALTGGGVGYLLNRSSTRWMEEMAFDDLSARAGALGGELASRVHELRNDLVFLRHTPPIHGIRRAHAAGGRDPRDGSELSEWRARLATIFTAMLAARPRYQRACYFLISGSAATLVTVGRGAGGTPRTPGPGVATPAPEIPVRVLELPPGDIDVTDLQREGESERAPHHLVRASTAVRDERGEPFGVLILETDVRSDLEKITAASSDCVTTYVSDDRGHLLSPSGGRLQSVLPELGDALGKPDRGTSSYTERIAGHGGTVLLALAKVRYAPARPQHFWAVAVASSEASRSAPIASASRKSVFVTLALTIASAALAMLLAARITHPLRNLMRAARQVAAGEPAMIASSGAPEIASLGQSLRDMVATVNERERCLEQLGARSRAVLRSALDPIVTIDARGRIESVNPACLRLFGYGESELIGENIKILMMPGDAELHDGYLRRYDETGIARIIGTARRVEGRRRDGSAVPLQLSISEVELPGRQTFTGVLRDISAEVAAERGIMAAKEQAERANAVKSRFLTNMSHELRTPLNSILGFSRRVLRQMREDRADERDIDALATIERKGAHLLELINAVLDLSEIEAGRMEVAAVDFDLVSAAHDALEQIAPLAEAKGLTTEVRAEGPLRVHTDRTKVMQILGNLLSNAAKYTERGGIRIEVEVEADAGAEGGASAHVRVRDTGIGIDEAARPHLFQSFRQLAENQNLRSGGTGLGLVLCASFTDLLGGRLSVASELGVGSTFTLTIPLALPVRPPVAVAATAGD